MDTPQSLIEAVRYFSDVGTCHDYMRKIKWPDGIVTCPECGSDRIGEIKTRRLLRCKLCRKQFSYKVGTIFEDSPLGLDKWFVAVWSIANCKNGISSHELSRAVGVTQKTAWFMLHRIREAMKTGTFRKLKGIVEADETFVGGKAKNMHAAKRKKVIKGRGTVNKTIVQGVLERGGKMLTYVVPNTDGSTLQPNIIRNADPLATVYTDSTKSYDGLWRRFRHGTVDHAKTFVDGETHCNGVENFWSLLKRTIKGTYIHVAPFHLARYCDEQVFRYDNRKANDGGRFAALLQQVVGRRVTYRQLCAVDDCGFMGIT